MKSFSEFLLETSGIIAKGKLELRKTSVEDAYAWAQARFEMEGRFELDEEFPNFRKNYMLAKVKNTGKLRRKDMPVIRSAQVKEFQMRLMSGFLDIKAPFAARTDENNPFPEGLSGKSAAKFMTAGLKVHDGDAKDDRIRVIKTKVAAKNLHPIQRNIWADKSIAMMARNGQQKNRDFLANNTFFVLSMDNFIIDGHHRWLTAKFIDPDLKVNGLQIDLPIKKLLPLAIAFGDAMGNSRNH